MKSARPWYWRERRYTKVSGDSRTQQSHAASADVNSIVARFQQTGQLPPNPRGLEPQYADVTHLQGDLTERLEYAQQLQESALGALQERRKQLEAEEAEAQAAQEAAAQEPSEAPAT